ncbi:MAG: M23 family metallopeptidase [Myxococcota bacterium]|nr:M23 family metallopeptidase [Myxococcota bacterium]
MSQSHFSLFIFSLVCISCQPLQSSGPTSFDNDCDPNVNPIPDTASNGNESDEYSAECPVYDSDLEDYAPIQAVGYEFPDAAALLNWERPSDFVYYVDFSGTPGELANHEGTDYVHNDQNTPYVFINAAADGQVVYVRTGCPQSSTFARNTDRRECGSGWGNHIILKHGDVYTRYAHLAPDSILVQVGDQVEKSKSVALMGNTGRSELRHLHLELGTIETEFDPCAPSQSFDKVYDPEHLF